MANGFASSGGTLVAGHDEDGWFVTALVGHWNKSAASLHVAASVHSQAEIGTPGVSDCYLKLMQRAGGLSATPAKMINSHENDKSGGQPCLTPPQARPVVGLGLTPNF